MCSLFLFVIYRLSLAKSNKRHVSAAIHDLQTSNSSFALRLGWEDCDEADTKVHYAASMLHNCAVACQMQSMTCQFKEG